MITIKEPIRLLCIFAGRPRVRTMTFKQRERMLPMRVNVDALRQQAWRAKKLFAEMHRYAEQIGCEFFQDEIICDTEEKSRLLARWWSEHT